MSGVQERWRQAVNEGEAELLQLNAQIASAEARRGPGTAPDPHERGLKSRHAEVSEDLEGFRLGLRRTVAFEQSPARVEARKAARMGLREVLERQGAVGELAAELDAWAKQGLELFDQLGVIADGRAGQVVQAAKTAFPGLDDYSATQRQNLIEWALPHAKAWPSSTRYALVILLGQIAQRVENANHVFQIAPGWQFTPGETVYSFSDAARQQQQDLEHNIERIHGALKEPEAGQ